MPADARRTGPISFVTTNNDVANAHPSPSHASLSEGLGGHTTGRHETRACHDGNPGRGREHPYPTRVLAQSRAAREQRMPFTGCTTNVLTNGPITCQPNCCKRRSFLNHLLRSLIFSIRPFLWDSQPAQTTCVSPRSPRSYERNQPMAAVSICYGVLGLGKFL